MKQANRVDCFSFPKKTTHFQSYKSKIEFQLEWSDL